MLEAAKQEIGDCPSFSISHDMAVVERVQPLMSAVM